MTDDPRHEDYSQLVDGQLDELAKGPDPALYNAVLDACDLILDFPAQAQLHSSTITTDKGLMLVLPVTGRAQRVYWSSGPPSRVEAISPMP